MKQGTILGSQKGRWITLAALAAVLGALLFLMPGVLVQAQDSTTIEYTENSTDSVVTLSASDPEGATPITWSLPTADADPDGTGGGGGPLIASDTQDNGDFRITQAGVLSFKSPPDYENPVDGSRDGTNSYHVVVQATDGDAGSPMDTRSWFKVVVNVADIEEPGSIRLSPTNDTLQNATLLQPQVGVGITARSLTDDDGASSDSRGTSAITTGISYQWYRATSASAMGTPISSTVPGSTGTGSAYSPVHLAGGASDIGKYLRVVATYTDGRGAGKTATAVSLYPTIRGIQDNQPPSFRDGTATTRGVRETNEKGVTIGAPVAATDPEGSGGGDEKLTYWLTGSNSVDDVQDTNNTAGDANNANTLFAIDADTGQLRTKAALNREATAAYEVTVNVVDSSANTTDDPTNLDTITVTIQVLEKDESPTVAGVSTIEHVEGSTVLDTNLSNNNLDANNNTTTEPNNAATYTATDPEEGTVTFSLDGADKEKFKLTGTTAGTRTLEFKAKPDFEMPTDANKDNVYEVTVQASDDANTGKKAVTVKVINRQENGEVTVTPAQPRIGIPVTAALTDSDGVAYGPMWQWQKGKTSADDAAVACTGAAAVEEANWDNISGAKAAAYTPASGDLNYCLRAVATYNDGFHEGAANDSGLYVDPAVRFDKTANKGLSAVQYPSNNLPPVFASASTKRFVPENAAAGNDVGEPVTAADPNGAHTIAGYSLSGTDQASFNINAATGQIMTAKKFDHEEKPKHTVTVTATDTDGATDTITVNIYVVDVDEAPEGTGKTTAEITVEYKENRTDSVFTLSAGDPEGATPITWSLVTTDPDGEGVGIEAADFADSASFKISQSGQKGVLEFNSPPSYEANSDSGDDSYRVVVQATDGDAGTPTDTRSWFKMIVNVSDVEETGSIRLSPTTDALQNATLLQPQVGVGITARGLTDPDRSVSGISHQWYRTTSASATGTPISGATNAAYTPFHLNANDTDIGKFLRVEATYTDRRGANKTATAVSMYKTIQAITDNSAPSFTDGTATTRGVRETNEKGVTIGLPVAATDPEGSGGDEKLTYWLTGSAVLENVQDTNNNADDANNANTLFAIDADTGQLRTKAALNRESVDDYEVTVNVTDSSGSNTDTITVTIQVLEKDESPTVAGASTIEHVEGSTVLDTNLSNNNLDANNNTTTEPNNAATYTATDPEEGTVTFSLDGADKEKFKLTGTTAGTRTLEFKAKPDFEMPTDANKDNVYEVTVQASDDANTGKKAVTVKVINRQENGEVTVTPAQPRIGIPVTAALTDSDGVAYGPMWQWQKGKTSADDAAVACTGAAAVEEANWDNISGAKAAAYTPASGDLNYCLRAVATYNDGFHEGAANNSGLYVDPAVRFDKTANKGLSAVQYPSNNLPPVFASASTKRFVPENAAAGNDVGEPVTAADPNGAHTIAGYSLSGTDQASFDINAHTGQLLTGKKFNHEAKEKYTVTVTATDTDGATDTITVDIYAVDVDEKPAIMEGGLSISGAISVSREENSPVAESLGTYTATGAGAASATWTPKGNDASAFTIEGQGASVMLKFSSSPDYEVPTDANTNNVYEVILEATDGTFTATRQVTVTVTDADEDGSVTGLPASAMVGAVLSPTLSDPDGGQVNITWQWSRSATEDGTYDPLPGATTANYTVVEGDANMYLMVTATYDDKFGTGKTADSDPVKVAPADPILAEHDGNNNGKIDYGEVITAYLSFLSGNAAVSYGELIQVYQRFLADN